jgi:DNA-binding transcriptional LysR family regulator
LGYPLFTRETTGIKLTRKGEELQKLVETSFINFKKYLDSSHAVSTPNMKRHIRITAPDIIASYYLTDLFLGYQKTHPNIIFDLKNYEDVSTLIGLQDVDIFISPVKINDQHIQQLPLFNMKKKLYADQSYLTKYGMPKTVEDLENHCLLSLDRSSQAPSNVNWHLKLGSKNYQSSFIFSSTEALVKAAKQGAGIVCSSEEVFIHPCFGLTVVLPDISAGEIQWYINHFKALEQDAQIMDLQNCIVDKIFKG